jgi:hypothetical protein
MLTNNLFKIYDVENEKYTLSGGLYSNEKIKLPTIKYNIDQLCSNDEVNLLALSCSDSIVHVYSYKTGQEVWKSQKATDWISHLGFGVSGLYYTYFGDTKCFLNLYKEILLDEKIEKAYVDKKNKSKKQQQKCIRM